MHCARVRSLSHNTFLCSNFFFNLRDLWVHLVGIRHISLGFSLRKFRCLATSLQVTLCTNEYLPLLLHLVIISSHSHYYTVHMWLVCYHPLRWAQKINYVILSSNYLINCAQIAYYKSGTPYLNLRCCFNYMTCAVATNNDSCGHSGEAIIQFRNLIPTYRYLITHILSEFIVMIMTLWHHESYSYITVDTLEVGLMRLPHEVFTIAVMH